MSLSALLRRVEACHGPDRSLDAAIALEVAGMKPHVTYGHELLGNQYTAPAIFPAYTASVDAALALIGRVLPGLYMWRLEFDDEPTDWPYETRVYSAGGSERGYNASHKTPALALCAALLAAMIGEEAKP